MTKEQTKTLTLPHILFLAFLVSSYSISIHKNNLIQNIAQKLNIENFFTPRTDPFRILSSKENTEEICGRADEKLQKYYEGDKSQLDLDKVKGGDNEAEHIQALVNIVGSTGDSSENVKKYIMHMIPIFVFLAFAILAIPGWIMCCGFCCGGCCCCCCCKKPVCRFPFFIVVMACDALVVVCCIYGLAQSNNVFKGLSNFECSVLRFIGEIADGETKESTPKWGGFSVIENLLNEMVEKIGELESTTPGKLTAAETKIGNEKSPFESSIDDVLDKSKSAANKETVSQSTCSSKDYWLGVVKSYGQTVYPKLLVSKTLASTVSTIITNTKSNFNTVFAQQSSIERLSGETKKMITDIKKPIDSVDSLFGTIADKSGTIDDYGKMGFKLIFSILTIFVVALAALIVIYFLFGTTLCLNCKTLRCLNKCFIHVLWNILALLMILTFLIGSILVLVGRVGNDLVSAVSYLIGPKNIRSGSPILLGDAAKYIDECTNKDGDLAKVLGLDKGAGTQNIQQLQALNLQLQDVKSQFNAIDMSTIPNYIAELTSWKNYQASISLVNTDEQATGNDASFNLNNILNIVNQNDEAHEWIISGQCLHGGTCHYLKDENPATVYTSSPTKEQEVLITIKKSIDKLSIDSNSMIPLMEDMKTKYEGYINSEKETIDTIISIIKELTGIFDKYIGNGGIWEFINCKFLGNNITIILKYLGEALGKDIYTVGVMLCISGISIVLSIIFTILEVLIINKAIEDKLKNAIDPTKTEAGKVIEFKAA